jgi:hypothetical protein
MISADRAARNDGVSGFDTATNRMIDNFDTALTAFEADVHAVVLLIAVREVRIRAIPHS